MPPAIIAAAYRYKAGIAAQEERVMADLARRWLGVMTALDGDIAALSEEVNRLGLRSPERIMRLARYERLMTQAYAEFQRYERFAADLVTENQTLFARLGIDYGLGLMLEAGEGASLLFDRIPVNAVEFAAGFAGDGSPLTALLADAWPDVAARMGRDLVNAVALGRGAAYLTAQLQAATNMGLYRAALIARTELMRVYREANLAQYRSSPRIEGFMRVAAHDSRVCPACLLDEGHVYPIDATLPEHPQGRCSTVPVMTGRDRYQWLNGAAWLEAQAPARQIAILGRERWDAWQEGAIRLEAIPQRVDNATWGPSMRARPLTELIP